MVIAQLTIIFSDVPVKELYEAVEILFGPPAIPVLVFRPESNSKSLTSIGCIVVFNAQPYPVSDRKSFQPALLVFNFLICRSAAVWHLLSQPRALVLATKCLTSEG